MSELTLGDLQRFHADLLTIRSAGVELQFQNRPGASLTIDTSTAEALRSSLMQIEEALAAAKDRGTSINSLIQASDSLPPQYVTAFRSWYSTGQLPLSFEPLVGMSDETKRRRGAHRVSVVQPIIWLVVAYFALLFICLITATSFLNLTEDMRMEPGLALSALLVVREWLPVWIWAAPAAILTGGWYIWNCNPGGSVSESRTQKFVGSAETLRRANLAEQTADLIQQGVEPNQAINMLEAGGLGTFGRTPHLPPLLMWAAHGEHASNRENGNGDDDARARMRLASSIYRGIASVTALQQQRLARTRVSSILLGGLLVLCISLCVFGPLVELLYFLADEHGG